MELEAHIAKFDSKADPHGKRSKLLKHLLIAGLTPLVAGIFGKVYRVALRVKKHKEK